MENLCLCSLVNRIKCLLRFRQAKHQKTLEIAPDFQGPYQVPALNNSCSMANPARQVAARSGMVCSTA